MIEERLTKAIKFFRNFQDKSDKDIYRRSVLKFCELVEEHLKNGEKIGGDPVSPEEAQQILTGK